MTPVPRTTAEWARVRHAKLDVLTRYPHTVAPEDYPDVRPEVVMSWRRSMLAGVNPEAREYAGHERYQPRSRLAAVAEPVLNRLKDEISDLNCWGFLADRACRLLTVAVGDFPEAERVHRQNLRAGMSFAEDVMGTNGMACAHETQQAFIVSGTEHFRTDTEILTTTGVIIRDPFTKRYAGILGAHCMREYGSAALVPLVTELGRSIEAQLLASRSDGEREFFDAFSAAQRRYHSAVVAVSDRLCVVSTRARALVHEADEELLRRLAEESGSRQRTVRRSLSSGETVTIEVLPVPRTSGAIFVLQPVDRAPSAVAENRPVDFRRQLARALREGRPVLLTGERGCGKRHEARAALTEPVEFTCAEAYLSPNEWLRALRDERRPVILSHVTELPPELRTAVADLVTGARVPLIGTATDDSAAPLLRESFPVTVPVPPLRERRHEFSAVCASLLAGAALTPRAEAALMASDWPGNIRQLSQVLESARIRVAGRAIDLPDLPARHRSTPLDEVQRAERRVLAAALRETGGDRNAVAAKLGISRATVYRKLKRHELY